MAHVLRKACPQKTQPDWMRKLKEIKDICIVPADQENDTVILGS
jgi:predicted secreted protein